MGRKKIQISVTLTKEIYDWMEYMIEEEYEFANRPHAIEYVLRQLKKQYEKERKED